jgi:CRP/FNR family cyclic AMP-dependent transcriptional regulator
VASNAPWERQRKTNRYEGLCARHGTTRSRVSFFMNKFRQLGFIDYSGGIAVHSSLLNVVLHDRPQIKI